MDENLATLLPKSLSELSNYIGYETCLKLVEIAGGSKIYVAKSINPCSKLATLGLEAVRQIVDIYGGSFINIPVASKLKKHQRNREIAELRKTLSVQEIAKLYQLTERQVWTILKKLKQESDATTFDGQLAA